MASYEPLHEMNDWNELSTGHRLARYVVCYLLWAVFVTLGGLTAVLIRESYLGFLPVWGPFRMTGVDRFSVLVLVIALLAFVLYIEHYLRRGVVTGTLTRRAVRAAIWIVPITGLFYLTSILIPMWVSSS